MAKTLYHKENKNALAEFFYRRMEWLGISVIDLCDRVYLCKNTIYRKLNRPIDNWTMGDIVLFCNALEVPISSAMDCAAHAAMEANK